jgi:hypothetical protein
VTDQRSQTPIPEPDGPPPTAEPELAAAATDDDAALPTAAPAPDAALPSPEELRDVAEPAVVRRAPRYRSFVLAGALVGVLLAVVLVLAVPGDQPLGRGPVLVFVALTAVAVTALLGAVVAVLVDRSTRR